MCADLFLREIKPRAKNTKRKKNSSLCVCKEDPREKKTFRGIQCDEFEYFGKDTVKQLRLRHCILFLSCAYRSVPVAIEFVAKVTSAN